MKRGIDVANALLRRHDEREYRRLVRLALRYGSRAVPPYWHVSFVQKAVAAMGRAELREFIREAREMAARAEPTPPEPTGRATLRERLPVPMPIVPACPCCRR